MKTVYRIYGHYYYSSGTFNAPKNGALKDHDRDYDTILEFNTREDAIDHLTVMGVDDEYKKNKYSHSGRYELSHGEYDRPDFSIRKFNKKGLTNEHIFM